MQITGPAKIIKVYIGDSDQWQGKPLYAAIVQRAHDMGMAGATVLHGLEGFGATSRIHTARILRLAQDLPVVIDIIDKPERIAAFLPILEEMVGEGLITVTDTEVVRYVANPVAPGK